jgi:E3 ubiquitin-protein ligase DMA1/2
MYSSMPSAAWSPSRPTDRSDSSSPPPASPTSPTRRLRGLSYLRSYTHNHILSRESQNSSTSQRTSTARVTVYPSPPSRASSSTSTTPASAAPTLTTPDIPQPTASALRRRTADPAPTISSDPDNIVPASDLQLTTSGERRVPANPSGTPSTAPVPSAVGVSLNNQPTLPSDPPASVARTHSAPVGSVPDMPPADGGVASRPRNEAPATANGKDGSHVTPHQLPSIRFTAHQDPRAQRPSLVFSPLARVLPSGTEIIKVGRYSERDNQPVQSTNIPSAAPVGFKSKVVSRRHCEFWWSSGRWFIKDVKSSSGTFLNHIRLSSPGTESKPFPVNDGDIVQLGIDFKGGEEMIFRCVKIRIELNKGWQNTPSSFKYVSQYDTPFEPRLTCCSVQSHKRLQELNSHGKPHTGSSSQDCSICLGPIGVSLWSFLSRQLNR